MAIFRVSAIDGALCLADDRHGDFQTALERRLAAVGPDDPVVVLVHGFRFAPAPDGGIGAARDPHRLLYALTPDRTCWKLASWPGGLGFGAGQAPGLCIGFAWPGHAPHPAALLAERRTGLAVAYDRAGAAGACLAQLLNAVAACRPGRPIDMLAHSLGARVALAALPYLEAPAAWALGRMILLGAAEFAGVAAERLARLPSGASPEIYNVTARANDLYDWLFERAAPGDRRDRALGHGLVCPPRGWIDLQLDHPTVRRSLAMRGVDIAPPRRRICHWSFYAAPGAMELYARILRDRAVWSVEALSALLGQVEVEPRWAHLLPHALHPSLTALRPPRLRRA
ncbi:MAG: alpha/beta hydrolase [Pseudomonadota bacterium]